MVPQELAIDIYEESECESDSEDDDYVACINGNIGQKHFRQLFPSVIVLLHDLCHLQKLLITSG